MRQLLVIRSSVNGNSSITNLVLDDYIAKLRVKYPALTVVDRDLSATNIPLLTQENIAASQRIKDKRNRVNKYPMAYKRVC